jgi:hypothetical protein
MSILWLLVYAIFLLCVVTAIEEKYETLVSMRYMQEVNEDYDLTIQLPQHTEVHAATIPIKRVVATLGNASILDKLAEVNAVLFERCKVHITGKYKVYLPDGTLIGLIFDSSVRQVAVQLLPKTKIASPQPELFFYERPVSLQLEDGGVPYFAHDNWTLSFGFKTLSPQEYRWLEQNETIFYKVLTGVPITASWNFMMAPHMLVAFPLQPSNRLLKIIFDEILDGAGQPTSLYDVTLLAIDKTEISASYLTRYTSVDDFRLLVGTSCPLPVLLFSLLFGVYQSGLWDLSILKDCESYFNVAVDFLYSILLVIISYHILVISAYFSNIFRPQRSSLKDGRDPR